MTDHPTPLSAAGTPLPKRWLATIVIIWAGQAVSMVTSYAAGYAAVWYVTETTNKRAGAGRHERVRLSPHGHHRAVRRGLRRQAQPQAHHDRRRFGRGAGFPGAWHHHLVRTGHARFARGARGGAQRGPGASQPGYDGIDAPARAREAPAAHQHARPAAHEHGLHRRAGVRHPALHRHRVPLGHVPRLLRRARRRGGACPGENPHRTRQGRRRAARRRQPARRLARRGREPRAAHVALRHHARHDHLRALELHLPAHDLRPLQRRRLHGSACRGRVRHRHDSGIGHPHGLRRRKEARAPHRHSHAHRGGGRPRPAGFCHPPPSRPSWRCAVSWQWRAHGTTAP